jgi:hypothetical protein
MSEHPKVSSFPRSGVAIPDDPPWFLIISQAAYYLDEAILRLIKRGMLRSTKIAGCRMIYVDSVRELRTARSIRRTV